MSVISNYRFPRLFVLFSKFILFNIELNFFLLKLKVATISSPRKQVWPTDYRNVD